MAYATLTQLKNKLGITDTSKDTQLTELLDEVSAWIDTYTKRTWGAEQTITAEIHDLDGNKVWLDNVDVTAVTSVKVGPPDNRQTLDSTAYQWNSRGRIIIWNWPYNFESALRSNFRDLYLDYVEVAYKYNSGNAPKDVELACLAIAANAYQSADGATKSEKIGDYEVEFQARTDAMPANALAILDAHRLRRV